MLWEARDKTLSSEGNWLFIEERELKGREGAGLLKLLNMEAVSEC